MYSNPFHWLKIFWAKSGNWDKVLVICNKEEVFVGRSNLHTKKNWFLELCTALFSGYSPLPHSPDNFFYNLRTTCAMLMKLNSFTPDPDYEHTHKTVTIYRPRITGKSRAMSDLWIWWCRRLSQVSPPDKGSLMM